MPLKVLVVDPQDNAEQLYKQTLGNRGHRLHIIPSQETVIDELQSADKADAPFQLILLDDAVISPQPLIEAIVEGAFDNRPLLYLVNDPEKDIIVNLVDHGIGIYLKPIVTESLQSKVKHIENQLKFREKVETQQRATTRIAPYMKVSTMHLALDNDPHNIPLAISYILAFLEQGGAGEDDLFRVKLGLTETVINSIAHGNLEMSSIELKEGQKNFALWDAELERRAFDPQYHGRRVQVEVRHVAGEEIMVTLEDEGHGFDIVGVLDADTTGASMFASFGRGLQMVKATSDRITHNKQGNRITVHYVVTPTEDEEDDEFI